GMMAPGMGGGAAGARGSGGRAAAGAGRPGGATAGRGGMAGMGGGAGYAEEEQVRNTWLEEDEDVWGAGGDATPGILR
ncbi:hypothetical protein ACFT2B_27895, partial [Micromonospora sp. NPDC057140]